MAGTQLNNTAETSVVGMKELRAFTLVELLVVIGIIGALIGIVLVVGQRVVGGSKEKTTREVILALDSVLTEFNAQNSGSIPPAYAQDPRPAARNKFWPVADAYRDGQSPDGLASTATFRPINSVGLFLLQCQDVPACQKLISGIPSKFTRQYTPDGDDANADLTKQPKLLTVNDAWGNPIRYVHPAFDGLHTGGTRATGARGAQEQINTIANFPQRSDPPAPSSEVRTIRRNALDTKDRANWTATGPAIGDSDGGKCPGNRPYFYSAGPDGDPSTIEDNVYTTKPTTRTN
jgi:prepilin-type N-terminal cleavage/methylation domain-containing protein